MIPPLENLKAELDQHDVGSPSWLAIVAEIVALLNQILNPPKS